jgi:trk system potassium uptake protein TrkH
MIEAMPRPQVFSPAAENPHHAGVRARLQMARQVWAVAAAMLAQFAVSMPDGYFGPSDEVTPFGVVYSAGILVLLTLTITAQARRSRWGPYGAMAIFAINVGLFVPPLVANPVIAGVVVLWNFYLLSRIVLSVRTRFSLLTREPSDPDDDLAAWLALNGPAARHLVMVALVATVAVVGYEFGWTAPAHSICVALQVPAVVVALGFFRRWSKRRRWVAFSPLVLVAAAFAASARPEVSLALLAAFDAVFLVLVATRSSLFSEVLQFFYGRPALLILVSFLLLIGFGTLLLTFPAASAHDTPIQPVDALFTATSAACVTGLIVLDTPHDLSIFGQLVVLLLIQIGGLNIMVLSTFAALLLGRGLGLRGERALGEMLDLPSVTAAYRLIGFIVVSTLVVEGVGAAILGAVELERGASPLTAAWRGIFHSISAFCNAGFALSTDSLVGYRDQPLVLLVMAALITLGGLGFAVLAFAWLRLKSSAHVGLATQVRIVLLASAALTVFGFAGVALAEWNHGLAGLATGDKLVNALFQSVTCRTAGFNSVGIDGLQPATLMLFMTLMFVGASPGGTGGGIKTTTLVVLLSAIPAIASGRQRVVLLKRTVSLETVFRCAAIAVVAMLVVIGGVTTLLVFERQDFLSLVFETVSAFGTVGLSLGATAALGISGKLVIVIVMLIGRVGPLSLALLFGRKRQAAVGYPEARIMVG